MFLLSRIRCKKNDQGLLSINYRSEFTNVANGSTWTLFLDYTIGPCGSRDGYFIPPAVSERIQVSEGARVEIPRALPDVSRGMVNRFRNLLKLTIVAAVYMEQVFACLTGKEHRSYISEPEVSCNVHQRNRSKRTCELLGKNMPLSFQY